MQPRRREEPRGELIDGMMHDKCASCREMKPRPQFVRGNQFCKDCRNNPPEVLALAKRVNEAIDGGEVTLLVGRRYEKHAKPTAAGKPCKTCGQNFIDAGVKQHPWCWTCRKSHIVAKEVRKAQVKVIQTGPTHPSYEKVAKVFVKDAQQEWDERLKDEGLAPISGKQVVTKKPRFK